MRYIIEQVGNRSSFCGALVNLDQSKAFDRVDHRYQVVVLKVISFGPVFKGWIMYCDNCSDVELVGYLAKLLDIEHSIRRDWRV